MGKSLVAGDFNDTTSLDESKSSTSDSNASQRRKFGERINNCNLLDMCFSGSKFTWINGRQGQANTKKRLDRAMCNSDWRALFPEGGQILPRTYSDHSPLLIRILGRSSIGRFNKPFRFETTWMMDSSFENLGHNSWTGDNIFDCIKNFTNEAIAWNENVFGNIFSKKRGILARLGGIQKSQDTHYSHNLQVLQKELVDEYNNILCQ